jgi:hypothetical protein
VGLDTTCVTTFHYPFTGPATTNAQLAGIAPAVEAAWQAGPILSTHPSTIFTAVEITDLTTPSAGYVKHPVNHPGTAGGGPLPANACVLVNYPIQRRYRGGKPRSYVPMGTDTDLVNPQTWAAASVTNFTTRMVTYNQGIQAITWSGGGINGWVSVSYFEPGEWVPDPPPDNKTKYVSALRPVPVQDTINGIVVNSLVGSQRKRIRGRN